MKRIIRVSNLGLGHTSHIHPVPEVWYQLPLMRGMLYVMEDIEQLNFKTDFHHGPVLIRVETTNFIYVLVKE